MNKKHIFAIIIFGFLVYSNTLKNPFLWDDGLFIQNGNFIKKFENALVFFSPKDYFKYTQDLTYRPLPFVVHMINYKIFNTRPAGHRLVNIFLHIANAVLIYFLVLHIFKNGFMAFLSGLVFAVHPSGTEVVNMVSFVETQLSAILFLLAFLLYLKSRKFEALLCYFLSVFAKETAIVLPAVIILYDLTLRGTTDKKANVRRYLYFFAVAVFYLVVRFFLFRQPVESMIKYPGGSLALNILTMLKAVPVYLSAIFLPFNLSVEHNIKVPATFFEAQVISGFFAVIIFAVILIYSYKKSKTVFFFLMWILITFLPTSNIIPMQNIVAERYLYLPLAGICAIIALLISKISVASAIMRYCAAFCIFIFFSVLTVNRNRDWKDDFTFYSKTLKQNPDSPGANLNISAVYKKNGDYKKAAEFVNRAIFFDPDYLDNNAALAAIYQDSGDYDRALAIYEKMVTEKKYTIHNAPFLNIGMIYKIKKQYPEAVKNFNKALELNPLAASVYTYLAEISEIHGDFDKTTASYQKAEDINPDDYIALNAIGIIYGKKNEFKKALKHLKKAARIKPDSADIHFNIGYVYFLMTRYAEALKEMGISLELDPKYEKARFLINEMEKTQK